MPNADTFDVEPIRKFVWKYLQHAKVSIDPFARNKNWATYTNDLNPETAAQFHLEAAEFLKEMLAKGVEADLVIFDPPYSMRQCVEVYQGVGRTVSTRETQGFGTWAEHKDLVQNLLSPAGIVLTFGWNSIGMGDGRGFEQEEVMLVCHGRGHNDTICVAERRKPLPLFENELRIETAARLTQARWFNGSFSRNAAELRNMQAAADAPHSKAMATETRPPRNPHVTNFFGSDQCVNCAKQLTQADIDQECPVRATQLDDWTPARAAAPVEPPHGYWEGTRVPRTEPATELVEPAPRPQCSCDCPNYDSGCPVHGTPKHIADRAAASSPVARPQPDCKCGHTAAQHKQCPEGEYCDVKGCPCVDGNAEGFTLPAARVEQPTPQTKMPLMPEGCLPTCGISYDFYHDQKCRHRAPAAPVVAQRELPQIEQAITEMIRAKGGRWNSVQPADFVDLFEKLRAPTPSQSLELFNNHGLFEFRGVDCPCCHKPIALWDERFKGSATRIMHVRHVETDSAKCAAGGSPTNCSCGTTNPTNSTQPCPIHGASSIIKRHLKTRDSDLEEARRELAIDDASEQCQKKGTRDE